MHEWKSEFTLGDKVHIDGDQSITGTIVEIVFDYRGCAYSVSWWNNGTLQSLYFAPGRLTNAIKYL